MMLNLKLKSLFPACVLFLFMGLMVTSCGEDEVEGCTDPNADNFNPEATISSGDCEYSGCTDPDAENYDPNATNDDGNCVYARDKFLGDYIGSFQCPGTLSLISSDTLEFSIQPSLDASDKNGVIVSLKNVAGGLTFDLPATAEGDMLTIEAELLGVPVLGATGNVTGGGTATIDANDILMADIELNVFVFPLIDETQTCTLVGTKQ